MLFLTTLNKGIVIKIDFLMLTPCLLLDKSHFLRGIELPSYIRVLYGRLPQRGFLDHYLVEDSVCLVRTDKKPLSHAFLSTASQLLAVVKTDYIWSVSASHFN